MSHFAAGLCARQSIISNVQFQKYAQLMVPQNINILKRRYLSLAIGAFLVLVAVITIWKVVNVEHDVSLDNTSLSGKTSIKTKLNVMVPMRDGVKLAADIYLPDEKGAFPVLLCRTPYNKKKIEEEAKFYVNHGYAVVVMDSRGIYASQGEWRPYVNEGKDGYDTQQWLGRQPWCNGKIGMFGTSYPGFVQ
jgi:predicted acyl esterase